MDSGRFKRESGARKQVPGGGGDQYLAPPGNSGDARGFVNGEAPDIVAYQFYLAGVNPGPNCDAESGDRLPNRPGAADRASGTVEHDQESIAGRLNLAPAKAVELVA